MGGALAWFDYSGVACPWTTNGKQWPCIIGDVLTAMDLICWYIFLSDFQANRRALFCGSLFIAARQVSQVVVKVAVQEKTAQQKQSQGHPHNGVQV